MIHGESGIWKVERISNKRRTRDQIEYLCEWKDWGPEDDSWEPKENILDTRLIRDFESARLVMVNTDLALYQLRDRLARMLLGRGAPHYGASVDCPLAADPNVARAILERLAKPRVGKPLRVSKERRGASQDLVLDVRNMGHIAEIVGLQSARPDCGRGALRFSAGRTSNTDMACVHGPLILTHSGPAPAADGTLRMGVYTFTVSVCAVKFIGMNGEPRWAKMTDKSFMKPDERREEVVSYVKKALRGARSEMAGMAFDHPLCQKWAHLLAGSWCLSDGDAMPAKKQKKAKTGN
eukprot:scaffold2235_cov94-Phaeocystis_antarctica.AAC.1